MATATKSRRKSKRAASTVTVTVAMFDDSHGRPVYRPLRSGQKVEEFTPLTARDYRPAGGTPLHDATAKFIAHLAELCKPGTVTIGALADESGSMGGKVTSVVDGINEFVGGMAGVEVDPKADGKVLAVILTDGMENASREVSGEQVKAMIAEREAEGWTFIYLGANHDAWAAGGALGTTRSVAYAGTAKGTHSALRNAGAQAHSFLVTNDAYMSLASSSERTSVAEDGTVTNADGSVLDEALKGGTP